MSRCFPYPPPGYFRNGATHESLIESIKLQKETDKSKSERRKEKRAKKEEKKQKDKRINGEEKVKKQKKNPADQRSAELKETQTKKAEPKTEQLERSDLSEEHGQPVTSHRPSYSSDSTQNSNKRKRDDVILPEGPTVHGKPIKIRLLKKQKGPDQIPVEETVPSVPSVSNSVKESLVSNNRKVEAAVPATSGRENGPVNGSETRNNDQNGPLSVRKQSAKPLLPPVASRSSNSEVQAFHSNRQLQIQNYGKPVRAETGPSLGPQPVPSVSRNPDPLVTRKRSINELSLPVTNGPTNGPTRPEKKKDPIVEVQKKVGPTRHEKKLLKKHSKYEKLIGGWVPPVLEAPQLPAYNDDEEDWLSRKGKTVKSSCGNDVEMCQELGAVSSLWQPCARFLVEADMYAMPYTVPF